MTKKTYRATFSDGSIRERKTERTYAYAWKATRLVDGQYPHLKAGATKYGFSSVPNATEAARYERSGWWRVERVPAVEVEARTPKSK